jgi:hypothetical protein
MTLTFTISLGLIGLVVDEGWGYWRQEACLTAAQAAASGGIMWAMSNNSTWPPGSCTTGTSIVCQSTPTACTATTLGVAATSDVDAACKYASQNGFTASGKQNVTIAANTGNPPTASGVSTAYYMTVRVAEQVPLTFLSVIVGRNNTLVSSRATAGVISTASGGCIYVLDPTGSASLNASNGVNIQSECGYYINSNSTTALSVVGGAVLKALNSSAVDLVGGYLINNGGSVSPMPTPSSAAADPFASKAVPLQRAATAQHAYSCTYGSSEGCAHTSTGTYQCDYSNFNQSSWVSQLNMSPGVYCGGIQIGNVQSVVFAPGVYILDGGGMNLGGSGGISGGVTATGGVSFFNTGTASSYRGITIGNGVNTTFSAFTTGGQSGMLFYQDPSLSLAVNSNTTDFFEGGSNLNLTGSLYFPTTAINWSNGTNTSVAALVVYDVTFTVGAYFKKDTTGATGLGGSAVLGMVE